MSWFVESSTDANREGGWCSVRAAILFGSGTLLHALDHLRRGTDAISSRVMWAGTVTTPIAIVAIFLALTGFRYVPHIAVAFRTLQVIGIQPFTWPALAQSGKRDPTADCRSRTGC